jgi:hypothetical protein
MVLSLVGAVVVDLIRLTPLLFLPLAAMVNVLL